MFLGFWVVVGFMGSVFMLLLLCFVVVVGMLLCFGCVINFEKCFLFKGLLCWVRLDLFGWIGEFVVIVWEIFLEWIIMVYLEL